MTHGNPNATSHTRIMKTSRTSIKHDKNMTEESQICWIQENETCQKLVLFLSCFSVIFLSFSCHCLSVFQSFFSFSSIKATKPLTNQSKTKEKIKKTFDTIEENQWRREENQHKKKGKKPMEKWQKTIKTEGKINKNKRIRKKQNS